MPDRQDDLNPASDLAPFADALKRLAPQPAHLSRDALLFEAGRAAAAPRTAWWVWPSATAAFGGLSFVLAAFHLSPNLQTGPAEPPAAPNYVFVPDPVRPQPEAAPWPSQATPAPKPKPPAAKSGDDLTETARLLRQRRDVLRWGLDMLPNPKPAAGGPSPDVTAREVTHWLSLPPGTFALPAAMPRKPVPKNEDDE